MVTLIKDSSYLKINYIAQVRNLGMDYDIGNDGDNFNDDRASGIDLSLNDVAMNESDSLSDIFR